MNRLLSVEDLQKTSQMLKEDGDVKEAKIYDDFIEKFKDKIIERKLLVIDYYYNEMFSIIDLETGFVDIIDNKAEDDDYLLAKFLKR